MFVLTCCAVIPAGDHPAAAVRDQKTELMRMMVLVAHHTKHATYTCPDSGPQCAYIIAVGCLNFTRLEAPVLSSVGDGSPTVEVLSLSYSLSCLYRPAVLSLCCVSTHDFYMSVFHLLCVH